MKTKDIKQFEVALIFNKLDYVIQQLEQIRAQIPESDRKNWEFEWDYSNCFYESDSPNIILRKQK